jgi:predicted site-specific integrase-resolvase
MANKKEATEVQRKVYTPSDVMNIFQISRPTFSDWKRKGIFKVIAIPGQRRIYVTAESVDQLLSPQKRN